MWTKNFSLFQNIQAGSGALPVSYSIDNVFYFMGGKRLACEANRSPLFIAKFKNEWSCSSTTRPAFVAYTGLTLNLRSYILIFQNELL
jgi:hypothetical protein